MRYAIIDGIRVQIVIVATIHNPKDTEFHLSFNPPLALVDDVRSALKQVEFIGYNPNMEISLKKEGPLWVWRLHDAF